MSFSTYKKHNKQTNKQTGNTKQTNKNDSQRVGDVKNFVFIAESYLILKKNKGTN